MSPNAHPTTSRAHTAPLIFFYLILPIHELCHTPSDPNLSSLTLPVYHVRLLLLCFLSSGHLADLDDDGLLFFVTG